MRREQGNIIGIATQNAVGSPELARFGQFILANEERVTRRWITLIDRSPQVPASEDLTYRQLLDHLPALCRELGAILMRPDVPAIREQAARDASAHGAKRWQQGYNLAELLRELCLIRNDVLETWLQAFARETESCNAQAQAAARNVVTRFFDDVMIDSAVQFAEDQREAIGQAQAALLSAEETAHAAKSEFLHHVSHNLREPLGAIALAAAALCTEPGVSDQAKETLELILRNVKREAAYVAELIRAAELGNSAS